MADPTENVITIGPNPSKVVALADHKWGIVGQDANGAPTMVTIDPTKPIIVKTTPTIEGQQPQRRIDLSALNVPDPSHPGQTFKPTLNIEGADPSTVVSIKGSAVVAGAGNIQIENVPPAGAVNFDITGTVAGGGQWVPQNHDLQGPSLAGKPQTGTPAPRTVTSYSVNSPPAIAVDPQKHTEYHYKDANGKPQEIVLADPGKQRVDVFKGAATKTAQPELSLQGDPVNMFKSVQVASGKAWGELFAHLSGDKNAPIPSLVQKDLGLPPGATNTVPTNMVKPPPSLNIKIDLTGASATAPLPELAKAHDRPAGYTPPPPVAMNEPTPPPSVAPPSTPPATPPTTPAAATPPPRLSKHDLKVQAKENKEINLDIPAGASDADIQKIVVENLGKMKDQGGPLLKDHPQIVKSLEELQKTAGEMMNGQGVADPDKVRAFHEKLKSTINELGSVNTKMPGEKKKEHKKEAAEDTNFKSYLQKIQEDLNKSKDLHAANDSHPMSRLVKQEDHPNIPGVDVPGGDKSPNSTGTGQTQERSRSSTSTAPAV